MELVEINGNVRLYFKDFIFGLPVSSAVEHTAVLDSESELCFERVCSEYLRLFDTAEKLRESGKAFDLYFSVFGNGLIETRNGEALTLYYCHVQAWGERLAIELYVPGAQEVVRKECTSTCAGLDKALQFAFGGFVFTCLDFSIKEVDLTVPYVAEALETYCLAVDKQRVLDALLYAG